MVNDSAVQDAQEITYISKPDGRYECRICPTRCNLRNGQRGVCLVREADNGIYLKGYGKITHAAVEPIEKKPIYHYKPNLKTLSIGGYGCPLSCGFCLPGDTLISTPNGLIRIDQIQDGDPVFALDNSNTCPQLVLAHVGHVFDREVEEVIELEVDGQTIQLTSEHPVYTKRGWVEAKDLTEDDEVLCDKTYSKLDHSKFQT